MITDDPIAVAQRTFVTLLSAMAHPGRVTPVDAIVDAPVEIGPALAAGAIALLDAGVAVWVAPNASAEVRDWLVAETGCRLVASPHDAEFGLLLDTQDALAFERWRTPRPEIPARSTTLLTRVESLSGDGRRAYGMGGSRRAAPIPRSVSERFWRDWSENAARCGCAIDCLLFDARCVMGLPRPVLSAAL